MNAFVNSKNTIVIDHICLGSVACRRGCGGCDSSGHSAWGASKDPVFIKKSVGKCSKIREKVRNKRKKVMRLGIQDVWWGIPKKVVKR